MSKLIVSTFVGLLFALYIQTAIGVDATEEWIARYSATGALSGDNTITAVITDANGNVYVGGYSDNATSTTGTDALTIKYDAAGNQLWVRRYDFTNDGARGEDAIQSIAVDTSGNVYVGGYSYNSATNNDALTIKYDAVGNQLWAKRYDHSAGYDRIGSLAIDAVGNVYVGGASYNSATGNDALTIKYDSAGNQLWARRYDYTGDSSSLADGVSSLAVDASGNVYVGGSSRHSTTGTDALTIKYDTAGNQLWVSRYDYSGGMDYIHSLAVDANGHVYVGGGSVSSTPDTDALTIKYDAAGNQLWASRYDFLGRRESILSLAIDASGNVYVGGYSYNSVTSNDALTIKYDTAGNQLWVSTYDYSGGSEHIQSLAVDASSNVYVGGTGSYSSTGNDALTIKYNMAGNRLWVKRYDYTDDDVNGSDGIHSLVVDASGNVYVGGASYNHSIRGLQALTIKYSQTDPDIDDDGIFDSSDNCPDIANAGQDDNDIDGLGDACDTDDDNDNVLDGVDNCHFTGNSDQTDSDGDGSGDVCDDDVDGDGVFNGVDICLINPDPLQEDNDVDGVGDACDNDDDNDTILDGADNCQLDLNTNQDDFDGDNIGDVCDADVDGDSVNEADGDNCPFVSNSSQEDADGDGFGDACDDDDDNDGIDDSYPDNCQFVSNPEQLNSDTDAFGDACDQDDDNDTIQDDIDNCPVLPNSSQGNTDGDSEGNACDLDDDNDGIEDLSDNCPLLENTEQANFDGDSFGNACDPDDDNDNVADVVDNCPLMSNQTQDDSDVDGLGDECDPDDDNDTVLDGADNCSLIANITQSDADNDGRGDVCDNDLDGDASPNNTDNCPVTANMNQNDFDGDGLGDACDSDDDNDTIADTVDNCPLVANVLQGDWEDDGLGDVCDPDDDNDTVNDGVDNCPLSANTEQGDFDSDGLGNVCDPDDDNDGVTDLTDNCPALGNPEQADADGDGQGNMCDLDDDNDLVEDFTDNCPYVPNTGQGDYDYDGLGDACDPDMDGDGVESVNDICPNTPEGEIVEHSTGCSIAQLCPCEGPRGTTSQWRNHGKFMSCTAQTSSYFVEQGLLTDSEKDAIVSSAAESQCGKKK